MQSTTYSYYSKVTGDVNGGTYTDVMTQLGQIRQLTNAPFPEYFPPHKCTLRYPVTSRF